MYVCVWVCVCVHMHIYTCHRALVTIRKQPVVSSPVFFLPCVRSGLQGSPCESSPCLRSHHGSTQDPEVHCHTQLPLCSQISSSGIAAPRTEALLTKPSPSDWPFKVTAATENPQRRDGVRSPEAKTNETNKQQKKTKQAQKMPTYTL